MEETIFSKIIAKSIPSHIIYEDQDTLAFLDINPFEKGHTLVVPKKPYQTIFDMPREEFLILMNTVYKVANHLEKKLNCGLNIVQNNKPIAGQEVMHVHFHLIPRRESKKLLVSRNNAKYLKNEMENYTMRLKFK